MISKLFYQKFLFVLLLMTSVTLTGQEQHDTTTTAVTWIIIKNDNSQYIGEIISQDAWEVIVHCDQTATPDFIPRYFSTKLIRVVIEYGLLR